MRSVIIAFSVLLLVAIVPSTTVAQVEPLVIEHTHPKMVQRLANLERQQKRNEGEFDVLERRVSRLEQGLSREIKTHDGDSIQSLRQRCDNLERQIDNLQWRVRQLEGGK